MNEQIEIEYKKLISKDVYNQLLNDYHHLIIAQYSQTNYYFTHPIFSIKKYMLRIREKNNTYELTLKRPYKNHRLETNINISANEMNKFINHETINNEITDILFNEGIDIKDIVQQFSLTTYRSDIRLEYGLLSVDYNQYNGIEDYELEYEVTDEINGYNHFIEILNQYGLSYTNNCNSKIQRVLATIKE